MALAFISALFLAIWCFMGYFFRYLMTPTVSGHSAYVPHDILWLHSQEDSLLQNSSAHFKHFYSSFKQLNPIHWNLPPGKNLFSHHFYLKFDK